MWSDNATKPLGTGNSQLSGCLSSWDWSNPPMISHHNSARSKVMESWPDSALLLAAFPSADSDFVRDSRVGRQSSPTTSQKVWKAWGAKLVRLSSLDDKDIGFPSRVSRRMGPLSPSSLLLYAELDCAFLLWEVIWDAQASCLLPRNSGVRTACRNFSLILSHADGEFQLFGIFSSCCQISLVYKQISLVCFCLFVFPCRKG